MVPEHQLLLAQVPLSSQGPESVSQNEASPLPDCQGSSQLICRLHLPAWGMILSPHQILLHTPITVTAAKAPSLLLFLLAAQGKIIRGIPTSFCPNSPIHPPAALPLQLQSAEFATLKQLVPLLEEVSHVYPEPVIQELAADLRIAICTHGAFATEVVQSAAQSIPGYSRRGGPAGRARVGVSPDPTKDPQDEGPEPTAPQPQNSTESSNPADGRSAIPNGHLAKKPAAGPASSSLDLQELLLSSYDPDIPTRAAALRTLSHLIEQRNPEALAVQKKLLEVGCLNPLLGEGFVIETTDIQSWHWGGSAWTKTCGQCHTASFCIGLLRSKS